MGIVNVTPDSFSDGGKFLDPSDAVAHALKLISEGADIVDVGGESTRPRSAPVSEEEELRRVLPVIRRLTSETQVPVSVDTMKPEVARAALDLGASILNNVAAARADERMWRLAVQSGAGYVCMHMQGTPQNMQGNPSYSNVVREIGVYFSEQLQRLRDCGMDEAQIILDPGIGFGKTAEHNVQLLGALSEYTSLGRPVLVGVSRKSFIGTFTGGSVEDRLPGSLACACLAVASGARIIRTHDVAATRQALAMTEAILAHKA
jgi:dihydropteroate synthase